MSDTLVQIRRPHRDCRDCGKWGPIEAQGRCAPCYTRWRRDQPPQPGRRPRGEEDRDLGAWAEVVILLPGETREDAQRVYAAVAAGPLWTPEIAAETAAWEQGPRVGPVDWAHLLADLEPDTEDWGGAPEGRVLALAGVTDRPAASR